MLREIEREKAHAKKPDRRAMYKTNEPKRRAHTHYPCLCMYLFFFYLTIHVSMLQCHAFATRRMRRE